MDITARFCGKEMQDYGACVARNPSSWQEQCQHMKLKVAQCTSSHPVIQKIRSDCAGQFAEFERCLQDHQSSAASCSAHMSRFLACAEAVDLSSVDHAGFAVHLWEHEDGGLIHGGLVLPRDVDLSQQSARS